MPFNIPKKKKEKKKNKPCHLESSKWQNSWNKSGRRMKTLVKRYPIRLTGRTYAFPYFWEILLKE